MKIRIKSLKTIVLPYIVVLLLILGTDSLWFRTFVRPNNYYFVDLLAILIIVVSLSKLKYGIKRTLIPIILMIMGIVLSVLIDGSINFLAFYKISVLIVSFYIVKKIDFERFAGIFINVMIFMAVVSLIAFALKSQLVTKSFIPIIEYGSKQYKTLLITNIWNGSNLASESMKNMGAFWEPGAYQAFLVLAFIFLNFVVKTTKTMIKNCILVVTIFSTFSTTGIICMMLLMLIILTKRSRNTLITKITTIMILGAIVCVLVFNSDIYQLLFSKFNDSSLSYISSATRFNSIFLEWGLILNSPVFGLGINNEQNLYNTLSTNLNMDSVNTTTSLGAWAIFGIVYGFLFNFGFLKLSKSISHNMWQFITLTFVIFILLNTENWCYSFIFNLLVVYGFVQKDRNDETKKVNYL